MKILPLFVLLTCAVLLARAQEDGETRPVGRGIPKRGPLKSKTTTTTTPAPLEDAEYEDEGDYPAEGEAPEASSEAPSSTTEGKKLVGTGVRPFRSNTDLYEILKKKRAQAAEAKLHGPSTTTTSSPAQDSLDPTKVNYNPKNKKRFQNTQVTREVAEDEAPAPKPSRGRFGRPATRSVQPEDEPVESPPARRTSRQQHRRGGN